MRSDYDVTFVQEVRPNVDQQASLPKYSELCVDLVSKSPRISVAKDMPLSKRPNTLVS